MSAGPFSTTAKYQSNNGDIYPIRVQPETLAATLGGTVNASPAGAVTQQTSARASAAKRKIGMNARAVTFKVTAVPTGSGTPIGAILRLPVMTASVWDGLNRGDVVQYEGYLGNVVGLSPEYRR